jgi:hypothetical protein
LNSIAQGVFIVFSATGAITARERYHKLFAPLGAIVFGAYIAVLFSNLH